MRRKTYYFVILLYCYIVLLFNASSSTVWAQVRINEFLIDPDQKVELINIGSVAADISGWFLDDSGGSSFFTIPQEKVLAPNSCSVFESNLNLNKTSSDTIRLFDNTFPPTTSSAKLIDSFSYKASSGSGITFKLIPDGTDQWATGPADFGFYNNTTNSCIAQPEATITPSPFATPTPTPVQLIEKIFLSEVMVNPFVGEKEWVELYNDNDFEVLLSRFFIDDSEEGGASPKVFSMTIPAKGLAVFEIGSSLFNNDGDSVRLLDNEETEKDKFTYLYSEKGKSWGRISFDTNLFCLQDASKNEVNKSCLVLENSTPPPIKVSGTTKVVRGDKKVKTSSRGEIVPKISPKVSPTSYTEKKVVKPGGPRLKRNISIQSEVLGAQTTTAPLLSKTLSLISFTYSVLTISSIFFKMKLA